MFSIYLLNFTDLHFILYFYTVLHLEQRDWNTNYFPQGLIKQSESESNVNMSGNAPRTRYFSYLLGSCVALWDLRQNRAGEAILWMVQASLEDALSHLFPLLLLLLQGFPLLPALQLLHSIQSRIS